MSNLKKTLSPWISIIFYITKLILNKSATKRGKWEQVFLYGKKTTDGYYQVEGKLFIWSQIFILFSTLVYGTLTFDFTQFFLTLGILSLITSVRVIEYLKPYWLFNI